MQGKVDNINSALEQEKKNQEVIKDQLKKREEEMKKKCAEIEAKLVGISITRVLNMYPCLNMFKHPFSSFNFFVAGVIQGAALPGQVEKSSKAEGGLSGLIAKMVSYLLSESFNPRYLTCSI